MAKRSLRSGSATPVDRVPYDDRGVKPFYPDFVIVRREGDGLVADLIDPHLPKYDDTWTKAKGLAEYAEKHGDLFGRLEIVIVEWNELKRMDVNNPATRRKAKRFQSRCSLSRGF
jgi:type III restriction enzyme